MLAEVTTVAGALGAPWLMARISAMATRLGPAADADGRPGPATTGTTGRQGREVADGAPGPPTADPLWNRISPAEREVALLVAEGLSNPGIAERLYVSRRTVESHVSSLLRKLGVPNRVALATLVLQAGPPPA